MGKFERKGGKKHRDNIPNWWYKCALALVQTGMSEYNCNARPPQKKPLAHMLPTNKGIKACVWVEWVGHVGVAAMHGEAKQEIQVWNAN